MAYKRGKNLYVGAPHSRRKKSKWPLIMGSIGVVFVLSIGFYFYINSWAKSATELAEPIEFSLNRGQGLSTLAQNLEKEGLINSDKRFSLWVKLFSNYSKFQAGLYRFENSVTPKQIAKVMVAGEIYEPVLLKLVIPEGFTYLKITKKLIEEGIGDEKVFEEIWLDKAFLKELGVPSTTLEGFIFPATYEFVRRPEPREIIKHTVETFFRKLPTDYEERAKAKNLSIADAVNIASLIELETRVEEEMPKVAEVILRRLRRKNPLGIDAALIYGIRDYTGDIKWSHLKDRTNRYNTRIHVGLPPTPIGSPSLSALNAVLNPTNKGYFYYVAKADKPGYHHFSRTLSEHNWHVRQLVDSSR